MTTIKPLISIIKVRQDGAIPVGTIHNYIGDVPANWMEVDGRKLSVAEYEQLYNVIGDTYCPKTMVEYLPLNFLQWVCQTLGFHVQSIPIVVPNPDYTPGMFRLPDLRGMYFPADMETKE